MKWSKDAPESPGLYVLDYGDGPYVCDEIQWVESDGDKHLVILGTQLYLCEDHQVVAFFGPVPKNGYVGLGPH
jgi:hypothetical protein